MEPVFPPGIDDLDLTASEPITARRRWVAVAVLSSGIEIKGRRFWFRRNAERHVAMGVRFINRPRERSVTELLSDRIVRFEVRRG